MLAAATGAAYARVLRPALFRSHGGDPERVHSATLGLLAALDDRPSALAALRLLTRGPRRPVEAFGLTFPGVVGLAAGMDKDGVAPRAWAAMGFGHVELGTVTATAQPGNPRPRLFRLPASSGLVNRMGFNNAGAAALAARLDAAGVRRGSPAPGVPVGISLGKTRTTPLEEAAADYQASFAAVAPHADYVAVNVSSPNTPGLRALQDGATLRALVAALVGAAREQDPARPVPVLVKVAPDLTPDALEDVLDVCTGRRRVRSGGHQHHAAPRRARRHRRLARGRGGRPLRRAPRGAGPRGRRLPRRPHRAARDRRRGHHHRRRRLGPARRRGPAAAGLHRLRLRRPGAAAGRRRARRGTVPRRTGATRGERSMREPYGARLAAAVASRGPLCVGVDPHPGVLAAWGLEPTVAGLERCARGMVEALGGEVAVLKPQSAFFEAYGSAGVAVLERVLADCADAGALSLLDVKRGDIGSTMDAYAAAYLSDGSPLAADAVTLSPYLGFGSLDGAVELARAHGRGVYVLALTSNPEGPQVQHATTADGTTVGQSVVDEAARRNAGAEPTGDVGVVVGATIGRTGTRFDHLNGSVLAPGLGAQGGTVADLAEVFGAALPLVLPTTSRDVMRAGPDPAALRSAARAVVESVAGLR